MKLDGVEIARQKNGKSDVVVTTSVSLDTTSHKKIYVVGMGANEGRGWHIVAQAEFTSISDASVYRYNLMQMYLKEHLNSLRTNENLRERMKKLKYSPKLTIKTAPEAQYAMNELWRFLETQTEWKFRIRSHTRFATDKDDLDDLFGEDVFSEPN